MRKILALLLLLPTLLLAGGKSGAQQKILVLVNLTIIDVTGGPAKPNMTVVIHGNHITDLGEFTKVAFPIGARIIDARGKYLIPGLWDMHVHWYIRDTLTLFTANGVTGIRQMFGNSNLLRWRDEIAGGSLQGPRMIVASPIIDGPQPFWENSITASNEAEGRQAVITAKHWDFAKVYFLLPRAAYFGIADEARKQGLSFEGHVPFAVSAAEASDAGQKSIEHSTGILLACSDKEAELRNELVNARFPLARSRVELKAAETFSAEKEAELLARFVRNETWQCPTLTVRRSNAYTDDPNFINDERIRYIPRQILDGWAEQIANRREESYAIAKILFQKELGLIGDMRRAGVPLLAGTDARNPFCFPGFSLHDELALLVEAGLTPTESLQTATLNPAKFFGLDQILGTIEKGKLADLVLLGANPLENIRNTQRIDAVIMNGRFYDRKELDLMLAQAQILANRR
jgi:imidazolonepropionase-like amidohydrolase